MEFSTSFLKQISLYTINKESNEQEFTAPLDESKTSDNILSQFTVKIAKENYNLKDMRELIFTSGSSVKTLIANIVTEKSNENLFKINTRNLAEKLFLVTQTNWKKGDLLCALFEQVESFSFVILKIDENNYIKKGPDGLWIEDAGFSKDITLQKAIYISIPKRDTSFAGDDEWSVHSIDKISGDSLYWNNKFAEARFKRDDKTNTLQFSAFMKKFVATISDVQEQVTVNHQLNHYAANNDTFTVDTFITAIYGEGEENREKRENLKNSIHTGSEEFNFDPTFKIDKRSFNKNTKVAGYVLDQIVRISFTKRFDSPEMSEQYLNKKVSLKGEDGIDFTDETGKKYAKVYYNEIKYKD